MLLLQRLWPTLLSSFIGTFVATALGLGLLTPEAAALARKALEHIPAERLVLASDCGMGREGMSRRHAFYKMVSIVLGTNLVRRDLKLPEAQCLAAEPGYSMIEAEK